MWYKFSRKTKVIVTMIATLFALVAIYFIYQYWLAILFITIVGGVSYQIIKGRIINRRSSQTFERRSIIMRKEISGEHQSGFIPTELISEKNGYRIYRDAEGSCSVHKSGQIIISNLTETDAIDYVNQLNPQQSSKSRTNPLGSMQMSDSVKKIFSPEPLNRMIGKKIKGDD